MYTSQVDFQLIDQINHALKKAGLSYEVHSYSGCAACGLHLIGEGENREKALAVIDAELNKKWLKLIENEDDPSMLYVESKFDHLSK